MTQVEQVRVRLLLPSVVAAIGRRTLIDPDELLQVIELCVERHGLLADIEGIVTLHWHNWQREPRETLTEHVRRAVGDPR